MVTSVTHACTSTCYPAYMMHPSYMMHPTYIYGLSLTTNYHGLTMLQVMSVCCEEGGRADFACIYAFDQLQLLHLHIMFLFQPDTSPPTHACMVCCLSHMHACIWAHVMHSYSNSHNTPSICHPKPSPHAHACAHHPHLVCLLCCWCCCQALSQRPPAHSITSKEPAAHNRHKGRHHVVFLTLSVNSRSEMMGGEALCSTAGEQPGDTR